MTIDNAAKPILTLVATFHSPFPDKFGIPRQSGMVPDLAGKVVFAPPFRHADYIRGIEGFSHLWLLWGFSANGHQSTSPLVRPPVLGGNAKMGVFATRSPFRPSPIGLSSVRLERVERDTPEGPVLHVLGADLMDGTPIYDIKPYLSHTDAHAEATAGFAAAHVRDRLEVEIPDRLAAAFSAEELATLVSVLAHDPRPRYIEAAQRVYGMSYAGHNIRFTVDGRTLTVISI